MNQRIFYYLLVSGKSIEDSRLDLNEVVYQNENFQIYVAVENGRSHVILIQLFLSLLLLTRALE